MSSTRFMRLLLNFRIRWVIQFQVLVIFPGQVRLWVGTSVQLRSARFSGSAFQACWRRKIGWKQYLNRRSYLQCFCRCERLFFSIWFILYSRAGEMPSLFLCPSWAKLVIAVRCYTESLWGMRVQLYYFYRDDLHHYINESSLEVSCLRHYCSCTRRNPLKSVTPMRVKQRNTTQRCFSS